MAKFIEKKYYKTLEIWEHKKPYDTPQWFFVNKATYFLYDGKAFNQHYGCIVATIQNEICSLTIDRLDPDVREDVKETTWGKIPWIVQEKIRGILPQFIWWSEDD